MNWQMFVTGVEWVAIGSADAISKVALSNGHCIVQYTWETLEYFTPMWTNPFLSLNAICPLWKKRCTSSISKVSGKWYLPRSHNSSHSSAKPQNLRHLGLPGRSCSSDCHASRWVHHASNQRSRLLYRSESISTFCSCRHCDASEKLTLFSRCLLGACQLNTYVY